MVEKVEVAAKAAKAEKSDQSLPFFLKLNLSMLNNAHAIGLLA